MRSFAFLLLATSAPALAAQQAPAVHLINTPTATSKPVLGNATAVRQLPNGRLIVNDAGKRQLLMFDPTLATATVIADSASGGANSYGPSAGGLIPYFADSSLFIDPRDLSMFVIDPAGVIARVAAVPRSQDAGVLGSNAVGTPGFDSKGRLVYRGGIGMTMPKMVNGAMSMPEPPDSAAIVRVDLATRKLDTAAFYKVPKTKMNITQSEKGMSITSELNPMPIVDDWAVMSDGTIAIVRGRDYHVDWVNADGAVTASAKLPFDWQRLSDDDKIAVIDSAKAAVEKARADGAASAQSGANTGYNMAGSGMVVTSVRVSGESGGVDTKARAAGAAGITLPPINFVGASELPDYRPAFVPAALTAGFILEEGLSIDLLKQIVSSMAMASEEAGVAIVAGDTKVVERGKADGLFINTTGFGWVPDGLQIGGQFAKPGDAVLISGTIGDHGIAVLTARGDLGFETEIVSDVAPLNLLIEAVVAEIPEVHVLRDPTRGGLATTLNEIATQSDVNITIEENSIPVRPAVATACEMLGFDPLYVANEGKVIIILPEDKAELALQILRKQKYGENATLIGHVNEKPKSRVLLRTRLGSTRLLDVLAGEMLPRIC